MKVETWCIEEMTGYEPKYTFYEDFSIAEMFGKTAIVETYTDAFENWKNDYVALTEFVMTLNWKIWRWYEENEFIARVYNTLWEKARDYAENNLKGAELSYYFRTTD